MTDHPTERPEVTSRLLEHIESNRHVHLRADTGTGKTAAIHNIVRALYRDGARVNLVANVDCSDIRTERTVVLKWIADGFSASILHWLHRHSPAVLKSYSKRISRWSRSFERVDDKLLHLFGSHSSFPLQFHAFNICLRQYWLLTGQDFRTRQQQKPGVFLGEASEQIATISGDLADNLLIAYSSFPIGKLFGRYIDTRQERAEKGQLKDVQRTLENYDLSASRKLLSLLPYQLALDLQEGLEELRRSDLLEAETFVRPILILDSIDSVRAFDARSHSMNTEDWIMNMLQSFDDNVHIVTAGSSHLGFAGTENVELPEMSENEAREMLVQRRINKKDVREAIIGRTTHPMVLDLCAKEYHECENPTSEYFDRFINEGMFQNVCLRYLENRTRNVRSLVRQLCLLDVFDEEIFLEFRTDKQGIGDYLSMAPIKVLDDDLYCIDPTLRGCLKHTRMTGSPGERPDSSVYDDFCEFLNTLDRLIDGAGCYRDSREVWVWEGLQDGVIRDCLSLPANNKTDGATLNQIRKILVRVETRLDAGYTRWAIDRLTGLNTILSGDLGHVDRRLEHQYELLLLRIEVLQCRAAALRKRSRHQNFVESLECLEQALRLTDPLQSLEQSLECQGTPGSIDVENSAWRRASLSAHLCRTRLDSMFADHFLPRPSGRPKIYDSEEQVRIGNLLKVFQEAVSRIQALKDDRSSVGSHITRLLYSLNYHRLKLAEAIARYRKLAKHEIEQNLLERPGDLVQLVLNDLDKAVNDDAPSMAGRYGVQTKILTRLLFAAAATRFPKHSNHPDKRLRQASDIFANEINRGSESIRVYALWARCARLRARRMSNLEDKQTLLENVRKTFNDVINQRVARDRHAGDSDRGLYVEVPSIVLIWYLEILKLLPDQVQRSEPKLAEIYAEVLERLLDLDEASAHRVLKLLVALSQSSRQLQLVMLEKLPRDLRPFPDRLVSVLLSSWASLARSVFASPDLSLISSDNPPFDSLERFLNLDKTYWGQDSFRKRLVQVDRELGTWQQLRQLLGSNRIVEQQASEVVSTVIHNFRISPSNRERAGEIGLRLVDYFDSVSGNEALAHLLIHKAEWLLRIAYHPDARFSSNAGPDLFGAYIKCRHLINANRFDSSDYDLPKIEGNIVEWGKQFETPWQRSLAMAELLFESSSSSERQLATRTLHPLMVGPFDSEHHKQQVRKAYGRHLWYWYVLHNQSRLARHHKQSRGCSEDFAEEPLDEDILAEFAQGDGISLQDDILELLSYYRPDALCTGMILVCDVAGVHQSGVVLHLPTSSSHDIGHRYVTIPATVLSATWFKTRPDLNARALVTINNDWIDQTMGTDRGPDHVRNVFNILFPGVLESYSKKLRPDLILGGSRTAATLRIPALEKRVFLRGALLNDKTSIHRSIQHLCHLQRLTLTRASRPYDKFEDILNFTNDVWRDLVYQHTETSTHTTMPAKNRKPLVGDTHYFVFPYPDRIDHKKKSTFESLFKKFFAPDRLNIILPVDFEIDPAEFDEAAESEPNWLPAVVVAVRASFITLECSNGTKTDVPAADVDFDLSRLQLDDRVEVRTSDSDSDRIQVIDLRLALEDFDEDDADESEAEVDERLSDFDSEDDGGDAIEGMRLESSEFSGEPWHRARVFWGQSDGPFIRAELFDLELSGREATGVISDLYLANINPQDDPNPEIFLRLDPKSTSLKIAEVATQWTVRQHNEEQQIWILHDSLNNQFSICGEATLAKAGIRGLAPDQKIIAEARSVEKQEVNNLRKYIRESLSFRKKGDDKYIGNSRKVIARILDGPLTTTQ